jgi:putative MATE family efflux protein
VISGVILGVLFWLLARPMVGWFGLEGEQVREEAVTYQAIMSLGTVTMFLIMQATAVLRGVGNSLWPMAILVGSNLLNVLLDVLMVFGYWGFPAMGVAGAAWATGISRGVGGLVGLYVMWRGIDGLCLKTEPFRWRFRYIKSLLLVGIPTSLQLGLRVLSVTGLFLIASAAYEGSRTAYVDGLGVCLRLEMVAVFMGMGWGAAATAVVGQNLGARRVRRAHVAALWLVAYGMVSMAICGGLIWFFRHQLFALIGPEVSSEGVAGGFSYLAVIVPVYPLLAVSFVISRALNGAGSVRTPLAIDLLLFIVLALPISALASGAGLFGMGVREVTNPLAVWWTCSILHVIAALAYGVVWWMGRWRRKRLVGGADADDDAVLT